MKSAGSIRPLDPSVANRIAAGETISCPSNAIKELIENSIDADSSRIIIEIERGGYDLIRIIDDGYGINYNDLPIACKAHTTSKISEYSDLQKISTFGFRGEALHSISMVTHLKIITMTEKDEVASVANYNEGELIGQIGFTAATRGTTIEARSLFYNYTVRLQGINPNSEAKKITDIISKYSVIYPQISFTVRCNKKETLMTYGNMSSSETVLKLLYGFDDINFFRCNFDLNNGVYVNLFLSEPNSKVKKKTNALFINGRLVKNDNLTKGVEEAYSKSGSGGFGGFGTLQFSFITMTIPPTNIDVNIHPKKEKVTFLNEREIIAEICERVKEIVTDRTKKKTNSSSKSSGTIFDSFFKNTKEKPGKNQTILQSFAFQNSNKNSNNNDNDNDVGCVGAGDFDDVAAVVSQAETNDSFNSVSGSGAGAGFGCAENDADFSLNISVSHNSTQVPSITSTREFSSKIGDDACLEVTKKQQRVGGADFDENDDGESVLVSSMPTVPSSMMSTSPVRSSLFAAFNAKPADSFSQLPMKEEQTSSRKVNRTKIAMSQKPSSKKFQFLSDDELDDFDEESSVKENSRSRINHIAKRKMPSSLTIVKDHENQLSTKPNNLPPIEKTSLNLKQEQPPTLALNPASKVENQSSLNLIFTQQQQKKQLSPTKEEQEAQINEAQENIESLMIPNINDGCENDPINDNLMRKTQNQCGVSLHDMISKKERAQVITDLPSFSPELQKKAIESIQKKNSINNNSSSNSPPKPKPKPKKQPKSLRSVFDDLKYDPTNGSQHLNSLSQSSQSRNSKARQSVLQNEDSSMKRLEDLFQNVGDNMKRKFRVVKLLSIINMRKSREETCDQELKYLFQSKKMNLVGFVGTKTVIFTSPHPNSFSSTILDSLDENEDNGIVPLHKEENKMIYIFNLFALMKDLLKHKFLELFSNLPTFNVEIGIDEITKSSSSNKMKSKTLISSKKSIQERFDDLINDVSNQQSHFFDDTEMKQNAKDCLEEKKDMLLDYFSIFYKNGMIKTMPDVIRGYRPSFASFPLFMEKLITEVDWEDETNCFESLIDQLASLYSIMPEDGNDENQKVANNLLLQFKTAVLPEFSDESYSPSLSLRENGSFVSFPIPPNQL